MDLDYAKVEDINDPDQKGRIQVRVLPQLKDVRKDLLPWYDPFEGTSTSEEMSFNPPKTGSLVLVKVTSSTFKSGFYYSGVHTRNLFDYDVVSSSLSNIDEISDTSYPNVKFRLLEDGSIMFNNTNTGDLGIFHNTGSYSIIRFNGSLINYSVEAIRSYNDNASVEMKSNGHVDYDCTQINFNGDSKSFVTHTELNTALQSFKTSIETAISAGIASAIVGHAHAGVTTGPGTSAVGAGSGVVPPIVLDISSSQTTTVKTGG